MYIRRETREKAGRSLAFSPVSKLHTHITYMLRQCTSIVYMSLMTTDMFHLCKHFPILSSFITYHQVCYYINTTGATSVAGTAYTSGSPEFPRFQWGSCFSIFSFMCMFCRSLFVILYFFLPFCCLFFDIWILITPLVSSNS